MAGYDFATGMSNNAVLAYDDGLMPASKIGHGIPASLIEAHVRFEEWHHTSKHYNKTKFYSPECVLATFGLIESEDYHMNASAVAALAAWKAAGGRKAAGKGYVDAKVEWLVWIKEYVGPYGRKIVYPKEHVAEGCAVVVKGVTATITTYEGETTVKRLSTKGFSFTGTEASVDDAVAAADRLERLAKRRRARQARTAGSPDRDRVVSPHIYTA